MKKFKLIFLSILCSMLLITPFTEPIHAENNTTYEELFEKYRITDVQNIPEGINPIIVTSPQELENVLLSLENLNFSTSEINSSNMARNIVERTASVNFNTGGALPGTTATVSLKVNFDLYSSGSFTGIQAINRSYWTLTGVTATLSLDNEYTRHSLNNGVITVSGSTDVHLYILIEDLFKLYTTHLNAGYKYEPYEGIHDVWSYTS